MSGKLLRSWFGATERPDVVGVGENSEAEMRARFVEALMPQSEDRRRHQRLPFCCPVTLYFDDSPSPIAGLARDISEAGMGFVLDVPVRPGEVTVRISADRERAVCARMKLLWCREALRHCYICGGEFISVFVDDPIQLRIP